MTTAPTSFKTDGFAHDPLPASTTRDLDEATLRAYPVERCLDYGCSIDDMLKLQARVRAGAGWAAVCGQLADDNLYRARSEQQHRRADTASFFSLHAAACFRLGQSAQEAMPDLRLQTYEQQCEAFSRGVQCAERGATFFEVAFKDARHSAWLFKPPEGARPAPCVVVVGGADGWCEAFHGSVPFYRSRGLAVCLLELPGQGRARLRDGSLLAADFPRMVSATLDALSQRGVQARRFGLVGHSLGGTLAIVAAHADERIAGCCTNGGPLDPALGGAKYPRVLTRMARMTGGSEEQTVSLFEAMDLPHALRDMPGRLLCLQGGADLLMPDADARTLVSLRGERHATLEYWPDGTHCNYNHAFERNCVLGNWFADVLAPVSPC